MNMEVIVKKQHGMKKRLTLNKEALVRLSEPNLKQIVGGFPSNNSCFPDICQENESSSC